MTLSFFRGGGGFRRFGTANELMNQSQSSRSMEMTSSTTTKSTTMANKLIICVSLHWRLKKKCIIKNNNVQGDIWPCMADQLG